MSNVKYVYTFGDGKAEGKADMKNLLGGKGANLAEMNLLGLPVPAGFTITTEVCTIYNQQGKDAVVKLIENDVKAGIAHMEKLMNAKFGSKGEAFLDGIRTFRCPRFHAGYDEHGPQPGYQ